MVAFEDSVGDDHASDGYKARVWLGGVVTDHGDNMLTCKVCNASLARMGIEYRRSHSYSRTRRR